MAKKQFRVEVLAGSTIEIEVAAIDSEKYDIGKMKEEDVDALINDSEYIVQCGLGDEWDGRFELKVRFRETRICLWNPSWIKSPTDFPRWSC